MAASASEIACLREGFHGGLMVSFRLEWRFQLPKDSRLESSKVKIHTSNTHTSNPHSSQGLRKPGFRNGRAIPGKVVAHGAWIRHFFAFDALRDVTWQPGLKTAALRAC